MSIFNHFDLIAPYYDRIFKSNHSKKFYELVKLPVSGVILDAGGGTGRISKNLKTEAHSVIVTDLSLMMLNQAKEKGGLNPVCSQTEFLPYPNNYFERIIMVDVFHHVCEHKYTANELWRVLEPGGRIIIEEPDIKHFGVKLVAIAEKLAFMRSKFISSQGILEMFNFQNAITNIETEGYNSWVIVDKP